MAASSSVPAKTIILAFDGTLNKFTKHQTNLLRLFGLLDKENIDKQALYYQPGVGTYLAEGTAWSPTIKDLKEKLDSIFAWYLDIHILDGYRFLMKHYRPGDHVCMFGFSRGAYTARCLAGMLNKVGLISPDNDQMVASAYEHYLDASPAGKDLANLFKVQLGRPCPVAFLGLWETVSSVGLAGSRHLPFSASNSAVKIVRHALALDERRTKFRHNHWVGTVRKESSRSRPTRKEVLSMITYPDPTLPPWAELSERPEDIDAVDDQSEPNRTDVMEVWFAGCHSDVGGGHGDPDPSNTLSDPSLGWMINQILHSDVPIHFNLEAIQRLEGFKYVDVSANPLPTPPKDVSPNVPANPLSTPPKDGSPTEQTESFNSNLPRVQQRDIESTARSRIHDELRSNRLWWVPELLPFRASTPDRTGETWRKSQFRFNLGEGRKIYETNVLVHESVNRLMEKGYRPAAIFKREGVHIKYVDDLNQDKGKGLVNKGRLVLETGEADPPAWSDFCLFYVTLWGYPWQYLGDIQRVPQAQSGIALSAIKHCPQ
ncbi:hypothetical protein FS837_012856 [Tulasnella sp. UAMH 9824]|nr:hypothetical protein FS837_012856 [Tulasnella sp. UAMH 9824]